MRCALVLTTGLLLAVTAGWAEEAPPSATAVTPPATPEALAAVLGKVPAQLTDWQLRDTPVAWLPVDVTAHLGTQASDLRDYRFQWGASAAYVAPQGTLVSVDALCFATALDAFGVYSRRAGQTTRRAQMGTEAFWEGPTLRVWQGPYYLILNAHPPGAETEKTILQVAQALTECLPNPGGEPLLLRLMPRSRMVSQSLRYFWKQLGAYPPFREALMAEYEGEQGRVLLLLARAENEAGARQLYQQTRKLLDTGGESRPLPGIGDQVELIQSNERGLCFVMQDGAYVVNAMRIGDRRLAEALLRITLTNIHTIRP